jgi:transcriptional regulator with XRE-family HTH domain
MDVIDPEIGSRIKLLRKSLGLSQKDISEKAEINRVYLNRIESGKYNPSFNTIYHILKKFNVSVDWLLTGKGQMFLIDDDNIINRLKDYHLTFLEKIVSMPEEKQQRLINAFCEILEIE